MNNDNDLAEKWVTTQELMQHLSLPKSTFELLIKRGMPVLRIGKSRRFKVSVVEKWLKSREQE